MVVSGCLGADPSVHQVTPSQVGPTTSPVSVSSRRAPPTGSPAATAGPPEPRSGPLSPELAAALPKELLGIPFEVVGIDPEATVRDIYDRAVGRRITGHFHRPLEDLELGLARPRDAEDRRGIAGFQMLAIRLADAPIAQVVGAYVAELASRPGSSVSASDIPLETDRSRSALALRVESSYAVWTDEAMFFFSVDERRIEEMLEASPQETPHRGLH
jgi:hypothetical protein